MAKLNLTPQQSAAVENRGGSLLVSAAAGSGKTKVLVERLFRYITAEHCHVDDFLIITYTKAAAAELRSKISEELSRRLAETPGDRHLRSQLLRVYQADIKTVDAFCTALLRENTHLLAQDGEKHTLTPDFRVLDENDAALLRKRVLGRVLEAFYENMDAGAALLADTLGAGRDDSALENLVLETYEKLQSHASPEAWLERNRTAWTVCTGDFDETPYADALLRQVRRKVHHWSQSLLKAASALALDPQKDDLYRGYGEKFIAAAESIAELETSNGWEETRQCLAAVTFPRLTTPKGMKDDAEVLRLKKLWEGAKGAMKKLGTMLDVSGQEAMEDLAAMAPAMLALLKLTADFSEAYRQEKLRMNCADFSDQEHLALRLLLSKDGAPTELGRQTAGRYREIMVDEYQDTNEVQNAIFQAVSREGQNLFTVGDVKQSIYRFRLADPTIFLDKYKRFASAENAKSCCLRISVHGRKFWTQRISCLPTFSPPKWVRWNTERMRCFTLERLITRSGRTAIRSSISLPRTSAPRRRPAPSKSCWPRHASRRGVSVSFWTRAIPLPGRRARCGRAARRTLSFSCVPPEAALPCLHRRWQRRTFRAPLRTAGIIFNPWKSP